MKKSSFVEGTILATLAIVIVKIMGMLYVIPFYAMIGVQGSALYAYAYSIYVIFLDISTAGLPIAISKVVSEFETLKMMEAKERTYQIGKKVIGFISLIIFIIMILFAPQISELLVGDLSGGGNTVEEVTLAIRAISLAILVVPFLSVTKGYLQGHKIINISSISQIIEQVVRIAIILLFTYLGIYVLNLDLSTTISLAVTGAFFGALSAYLYILYKIRNSKKELGLKKHMSKDQITSKEIIKKIFIYSIPFIVINTVYSLYSFSDMFLILKTMNYLEFSAIDVEFIATSITTWSGKISAIVTSIAMGMTVSLIPNIVSAFTLNNFQDVNNKLNQAMQIIILTALPMTVGISLLSKPIWNVFYGLTNSYGPIILSTTIFVSLIGSIYMITTSTVQSINKFKLVYTSAIIGIGLNIVLDVPLMLLFAKLGIPSYLGAPVASMVAYTLSTLYILWELKKDHGLTYKKTKKVMRKLILPTVAMIIVVFITKNIVPVNYDSRFSSIIYIAINSLVGSITYIFITYKTGTIKFIVGENLLNKIIKKLTFGKLKI